MSPVPEWVRQYVMVLEFLAAIGLLGYIGYRVDERYETRPWALLGGLLLGMTAGLYRMVRESRPWMR